jgi:hypothetical protein
MPSAVAMRKELRTAGRLEVSGARVQLRMSAGVHTDRFHLFLVGDSHKEFIITGPGASRTVAMEGAANAGEIIVSDATAAALRPTDLGAAKGPGWLLRRAPRMSAASTSSSAPVLPAPDLDLSRIPVALRASLLDDFRNPSTARHRGVRPLPGTGDDRAVRDRACRRRARTARIGRKPRPTGRVRSTDIDADGGKIISPVGRRARATTSAACFCCGRSPMPSRTACTVGEPSACSPYDIGPVYRRTYTVATR